MRDFFLSNFHCNNLKILLILANVKEFVFFLIFWNDIGFEQQAFLVKNSIGKVNCISWYIGAISQTIIANIDQYACKMI